MTDETMLAKQLRATLTLVHAAQDWERVRDDESLLDGVREFAGQRAAAIREELRPA